MQFMVRIELHGAKGELVYELLHAQAAIENLSRTLTNAATGEKSQALTGTYWTEAYSTWQEVVAAAKRAASRIHCNFGVMVAGDGEIHYDNCPPLHPTRRVGALIAAARGMAAPTTTPVRRTLPPVFAPVRSTVPVPHALPTMTAGSSADTATRLGGLYESYLRSK